MNTVEQYSNCHKNCYDWFCFCVLVFVICWYGFALQLDEEFLGRQEAQAQMLKREEKINELEAELQAYRNQVSMHISFSLFWLFLWLMALLQGFHSFSNSFVLLFQLHPSNFLFFLEFSFFLTLFVNTLFEGVCIRLTWHCHKHDTTPVMNMKESLWMFMTVVVKLHSVNYDTFSLMQSWHCLKCLCYDNLTLTKKS